MSSNSNTELYLFGMGNPLLDMMTTVDSNFLASWNLINGNAIMAEEKHVPLYDELASKHKVEYIAGGSAQNTVRACQWILQKDGATAYTGCVGKDKFSDTMSECMSNGNIKAHYMVTEEVPTGSCAVLVVDKERTMVANLSAAQKFSADHLKTIENVWQSSKGYFVEGYFYPVTTDGINTLAKFATENKKVFSLSLSAPFVCQFFSEQLLSTMPYIDVLFCNETEAEAMATTMKWDDKTPAGVAKALAKLDKATGERVVVVTCGAEPTVVCVGDKLSSYPTPKLSGEQIVDTNGAGDAFAGGFLSQYLQGKDIAECVRVGQYTSGVILGVSGMKFNGKASF